MEKIKPDAEDFHYVERVMGPASVNATTEDLAERYRLAQANKLGRLYAPPPGTFPRKDR